MYMPTYAILVSYMSTLTMKLTRLSKIYFVHSVILAGGIGQVALTNVSVNKQAITKRFFATQLQEYGRKPNPAEP